MTGFNTADLCDLAEDEVRVALPVFRIYGNKVRMNGLVTTLRVYEDNSLVRDAILEDGAGRILVVDGGASLRCALLGGNLAAKALENNWAGIVIYGCIRDRLEVDDLPLPVRAIATAPRRSNKRGSGEKDVDLHFAGIDILPGDYLYADDDGLLVASRNLLDDAA